MPHASAVKHLVRLALILAGIPGQSFGLRITSPMAGDVVQAGSDWMIRCVDGTFSGSITLLRGGVQIADASVSFVDPQSLRWTVCPTLEAGTDYQIVVDSYDGSRSKVISEPFSIVGPAAEPDLCVTSPMPGETWVADRLGRVSWSSTNPSGEVVIELRQDAGVSVPFGSADMNSGSVEATVCRRLEPGDYTVQLRWRVCSKWVERTAGPVHIVGSAPATLALLTPASGETLQAGSDYLVTWSGFENSFYVTDEWLSFQLTRSDGSWADRVSGLPVSGNAVLWPICKYQPSGSYFLIANVATCAGTITAQSDLFTIVGDDVPPTVTLRWPNGGEVLEAGSAVEVYWDTANPQGLLSIELYDSAGHVTTLGSAAMAQGRATMPLCAALAPGEHYRLGLWASSCPGDLSDMSDGEFTIAGTPLPQLTITSQTDDETWANGSRQRVTWTPIEGGGVVRVNLKRGWEWVALNDWPPSPVNRGYADVQVCDSRSLGSGFKVELEWWPDCGRLQTATSQGSVTLAAAGVPVPELGITWPTAGAILRAGSEQVVTWQGSGLSEYLQLLLVGEGIRQDIGDMNVLSSAGQAQWDVCDTGRDGVYHIEAWSCDCGCVIAQSGPFTITGHKPRPTLRVTDALAGRTIAAGTEQQITWEATDADGDVFIMLQQGGLYRHPLGAAPMTSGSFTWRVCPLLESRDDYVIGIEHWSNCAGGWIEYVEGDPTFSIRSGSSQQFDLNGDCVVDLRDVELFRACQSGPGVPASTPPYVLTCEATLGGQGYTVVDYDSDGDVDQDDFGELQRHFTGP